MALGRTVVRRPFYARPIRIPLVTATWASDGASVIVT